MQQRLPSLLPEPITFAHRGARADAPENTLAAFQLALDKGAKGLETDVWLTADGVPVLDHDGVFGRVRRRAISTLRRDQLPSHVPSLRDLIETVGSGYHLSLDLKDRTSGQLVIAELDQLAPDLLERTWLCDPDVLVLQQLRRVDPRPRLVHSTRLARLGGNVERHASRLAEQGIDALNLRLDDWNGGLVTLLHRFDRLAFAWNAQFDHELRPALRMGIDAVYSDYVDRMTNAARAELG